MDWLSGVKKALGFMTEEEKAEARRQNAIKRLTNPDESLNPLEQQNAMAYQGVYGKQEQEKQIAFMKEHYGYPEDESPAIEE